MKVGVHLVNFTLPGGPGSIGSTLAAVGRAAEQAGVANLSLMDHYLQLPMIGAADEPMLEGYTSRGFLAAHTETAELQLLVTGDLSTSRPARKDRLHARCAVRRQGGTRDRRRVVEREHLALGVPYPPVSERFERLEEALQIVRQMWSEDDGPFAGRHYTLAETICSPGPLARPPIMIGGGGEKKTLRLVARYADACNLFASPDAGGPAQIGAKLDVLRAHCEREGTDFDRIAKTILYVGALSPGAEDGARFVAEMAGYVGVGVTEVHLMPPDGDPVGFISNLGEHVIPDITGS